MAKEKILILEKEIIFTLVKVLFFIGILTIAPMFHNQMITGPIVNAILFIAVYLLSLKYALLIGLLPSAIALSTGLLPLILAPMIPFIMLSNAVLIIIFNRLRNKNYWLGVVTASLAKFMFLYFANLAVVDLIIKKQIVGKIATMMSWPQFFTAITGGIVAYIFLKGLGKIKNY